MDEFTRRTDVFLQWVQQQPGTTINPKICIADLRDQDQGRGAVARQSIEADEELFTIPSSTFLSVENSTLHQILKEELQSLPHWVALVLTMIYEDGQGQASRWWPYLAVLPTSFDTLIYWFPSEVAELQNSAVVHKIGRKEADDLFRSQILPIVRANVSLFGKYGDTSTHAEVEQSFISTCHRMATLINAYGFDLDPNERSSSEGEDNDSTSEEPKASMIPLADLLNADADLNNAHVVQNEASITAQAIKPIRKGDHIFNDFGELPRSDLLRRYGYLTHRYKQWDVVEIPFDLIVKVCTKYNPLTEQARQDRLALAENWGVLDDAFDLTRPQNSGDSVFPSELILLIHSLLLHETQYKGEVAAQSQPLENGVLPRSNEMYHALRDIISQHLAGYDTTIAEDALLLDTFLPGRHRMAVEVRLGEKEILAAALNTINNMLAEDTRASKMQEDYGNAKKVKLKRTKSS